MKRNALHKSLLLAAMICCAAVSYAQRYEVERGRVYFGNELMMYADARSFVDLGMGYAKDQFNVYVNGRILENVDPSGFRLKVKGAMASSFKYMGGGYGKDAFDAYYRGKKIE